MLTKEDYLYCYGNIRNTMKKICLSCQEDERCKGCDIFNDLHNFRKIIHEHFELVEHAKKLQDEVDKYKHEYFSMRDLVENPQPYKFEDLKPGMWVWDNKLKMCVEITDIIELEEENKKCVDYGFGYVEYKENHLFPVTKALEY